MPDKPVARSGQMHMRVVKTVESPVTANVLVSQSPEGDKSLDLAIVGPCDLVVICEDAEPRIKKRVSACRVLVDRSACPVDLGFS